MKKQNNQGKQIILLALVASIILLGANIPILAQNKIEHSNFVFSLENQSLSLNNWTGKFDSAFAPPKPDFSVMEKWFEIVKYEYTDPAVETKLFIWVKIKTDKFPGGFQMEFLDKDGVEVGPRVQPIRDIYALSRVGDVVKTYCDLPPSETDIEKIVTAKVIRIRS